jgi:hypothetical protein
MEYINYDSVYKNTWKEEEGITPAYCIKQTLLFGMQYMMSLYLPY